MHQVRNARKDALCTRSCAFESERIDYLAVIGAAASMSRIGNCYDAPLERFFNTLKVELVHQCRWAMHAKAQQALLGYTL
jgi:transposase InsO family protein